MIAPAATLPGLTVVREYLSIVAANLHSGGLIDPKTNQGNSALLVIRYSH